MIRFLYKIQKLIHFLKLFLAICLCIGLGQKQVWALYEAAPESYYLHQKFLNDVQFTEDSSTPLKGTWQYYPEQFITQPSSVLKSTSVTLPVSFKEITGTNQTYGTFIGHFKI